MGKIPEGPARNRSVSTGRRTPVMVRALLIHNYGGSGPHCRPLRRQLPPLPAMTHPHPKPPATLRRRLLDLLLPQSCLLCAADAKHAPLCAGCRDDLPRLPQAHCPVCALPTPGGEVCGACLKRPPDFAASHAAWLYAYPLDRVVQALKFRAELALADWMAEHLAHALQAANAHAAIDLLLPMPLHPLRLRQRGFNQAALLAGALGRRLGIPVAMDAAVRTADTPPQAGLNLRQRRRNLRGAFACRHDLAGHRVALVDDVMTSGSSLRELAHAVGKAGATRIECWVAARTPAPVRR